MLTVGFVGWRGMVGSVLLSRMRQENDFTKINPVFFSSSQVGMVAPRVTGKGTILQDAYNIEQLAQMDVIISCQGSAYTKQVQPALRAGGWNGYWLDAASALRMSSDSVIVLDPINHDQITGAIANGVKNYIGGNCTVSLLLMAIGGLLKANVVDWLSVMTYQAASGAGAQAMCELITQSKQLTASVTEQHQVTSSAIEQAQVIHDAMLATDFATKQFGHPLAASLLPWIDQEVAAGQTREEHKAMMEANKILDLDSTVIIDGICVRVASLRCHAQAVTIKLNQIIPLSEVAELIANSTPWTELIANNKEDTLSRLTPAAVTGTLQIPVGRVRQLQMGREFIGAFTVGDQLLWGAAEPLRRMLTLLRKVLHLDSI